MIPLKLQLKNFLSYGGTLQTIDFTPYHLICLSGRNGHGKSALLDAITWALWGQARKISGVAKADSHLLRLGQSQMLVIFDFEFNGAEYRIRREYAVTFGKQYAALDFGLVDDKNKIISLTNKTIRETQATIETTIGLDFESFINSAFLRQGQANEFSKKSPKERKDVLGNILGLQHYEILRKRASDKVREATTENTHLIKFQEKIESELQKLPELMRALSAIQEKFNEIDQQEKTLIKQKNEFEKEKSNLALQKNQQTLTLMTHQQKVHEQEHLNGQLRKYYEEWKAIHKKYRTYTNPTNLDLQKQQLLEQVTFHQQLLHKNLELKEKLLICKQKEQATLHSIKQEHQKRVHIEQTKSTALNTELDNKKNQEQELTKSYTISLQDLQQIQEEIKELTKLIVTLPVHEHDLKNQELTFEKRKMLYHQWVTQATLIRTEGDSLQQKKKLTHNDDNPSCPLCEQNLSASRKKFIKAQFAKQEQFLRHRLQRLTNILKDLKAVLLTQHTHLETLKKQFGQKNITQIKLDELHKQELKITTHQRGYEEHLRILAKETLALEANFLHHKDALDHLIAQEATVLAEHPDYRTIQTELEHIQEQLDKNLFDNQAYQEVQNTITRLEQLRLQVHEIQEERNLQQEYQQHIYELCVLLKNIKKHKQELTDTLKGFEYLDAALQKTSSREEHMTSAFHTLQKEKELLLQHKGSLENERIKLTEKEKEHKEQQAKIKELNNLVFDYQAIATAVSKDGIQALIIEDALPEIEHEANNLLGQLTDNQAHIIIESLRDLKKGGTKETLDIKISDAAGIRPYELFSGGEAFRIDFALRLAISKLLARRAGTSLQTLIIDEGFGSQDEDGLSHIMDSLYKIQDSFCKIIIVSHLPAMKDQFPIHFFVEKGSQGSFVRVIEQG